MCRIALPIFCALLLAVSRPAEAQEDKPFFTQPPQLDVSPVKLPAVAPGLTYVVDIHCKPRGVAPLSPITDKLSSRKAANTDAAVLGAANFGKKKRSRRDAA